MGFKLLNSFSRLFQEADSDMQISLDRIKIAERSLDAVLKLEEKCFGPKH